MKKVKINVTVFAIKLAKQGNNENQIRTWE